MPVHFLKPLHKLPYRFAVIFILLIVGTLLSASDQTSVAQQEPRVTYEDYDPLVMPGYSENDWQFAVVDANASGGQKAVGAPHASLTLTLDITGATGGFSLLYSKHPAGGPFQLYLDGGLYGNFDGYAETPLYTREISHITLPVGAYTLTLVNSEGVFWFEALRLQNGVLRSATTTWGLLFEDTFEGGISPAWSYDRDAGQPDNQTVYITGQAEPCMCASRKWRMTCVCIPVLRWSPARRGSSSSIPVMTAIRSPFI